MGGVDAVQEALWDGQGLTEEVSRLVVEERWVNLCNCGMTIRLNGYVCAMCSVPWAASV